MRTHTALDPDHHTSLRLQIRQELDQVAELGLGQLADEVGGHGRRAALAVLDLVLGDGEGWPSAVTRRTSLSSSPRRTPVMTLPSLVARTTDSKPWAIFLSGVTIDSSRYSRSCRLPMPVELGPDLAAVRRTVRRLDLVAAEAAHLGLGEEDIQAAADIAAGQGLAIRGQRIGLRPGCLVAIQPLLAPRATAGGPRPRSGRAGSRRGPCRRSGDRARPRAPCRSRDRDSRPARRTPPGVLAARACLEEAVDGRPRRGRIGLDQDPQGLDPRASARRVEHLPRQVDPRGIVEPFEGLQGLGAVRRRWTSDR